MSNRKNKRRHYGRYVLCRMGGMRGYFRGSEIERGHQTFRRWLTWLPPRSSVVPGHANAAESAVNPQ